MNFAGPSPCVSVRPVTGCFIEVPESIRYPRPTRRLRMVVSNLKKLSDCSNAHFNRSLSFMKRSPVSRKTGFPNRHHHIARQLWRKTRSWISLTLRGPETKLRDTDPNRRKAWRILVEKHQRLLHAPFLQVLPGTRAQ